MKQLDEAPIVIEGTQVNASESSVIEFMYCDFGPKMSEECWSSMKVAWLEINGGDESSINAVFILVPLEETDRYDGIRANIFSDNEARKVGWASWNENYAVELKMVRMVMVSNSGHFMVSCTRNTGTKLLRCKKTIHTFVHSVYGLGVRLKR